MEKTKKFKSTFEKLLANQTNSVPGITAEIEMVGNVRLDNEIYNMYQRDDLDQSVTPGLEMKSDFNNSHTPMFPDYDEVEIRKNNRGNSLLGG